MKILAKILVATGIAIWAIPFLSAALFGLTLIGLIRIKDKIVSVFIAAFVDSSAPINY
jgi:hypothetical protein